MAEMIPPESQSAADDDDRTTAAVKSVLIEIGQILGSFQGKFAVVGGAVPWLLLDNEEMPHVGSLDVDLDLDAESLGNDTPGGHGPTCVRRFVADTQILGDRTPEQWQQDAFGQVDEWLRVLGLRQ
jgi:hypothetical protein